MPYSIFHFFRSLADNRGKFRTVRRLDSFPFVRRLLSCRNKGIFPDLAIRLNGERSIFTGGELIELKDSASYTVASFNSTIPSRSKVIADIIAGEASSMRVQMERAGDDIFSLPERAVYYLVRGRKGGHTKMCLVYGSFFETVSAEELISQSFSQALRERLHESGKTISREMQEMVTSLLSEQETFSRVRDVKKASVKLRFRIMTEVKAEGNILNPNTYPEIRDDTLNLVLSCHDDTEEQEQRRKLALVFPNDELSKCRLFKLKHPLNGHFLVLQMSL